MSDPFIVRRGTREAKRYGAYVGMPGYASILACTQEPVSADDIAERTGVRKTRGLLKQFHALRLIHRVGWIRPAVRGFDQPLYLISDGDDVPARLTKSGRPMPHADHRPAINPKVLAFSTIIRALDEPREFIELMHETGLHKDTLRHVLARLRRLRLCFIAGHRRRTDGAGPYIRLYEFGVDRKDAVRPALSDRRMRSRTHRQLQHGQWGSVVIALKRNAGFQLARFKEDSLQSPNFAQQA